MPYPPRPPAGPPGDISTSISFRSVSPYLRFLRNLRYSATAPDGAFGPSGLKSAPAERSSDSGPRPESDCGWAFPFYPRGKPCCVADTKPLEVMFWRSCDFIGVNFSKTLREMVHYGEVPAHKITTSPYMAFSGLSSGTHPGKWPKSWMSAERRMVCPHYGCME